MDSAFDSLMDLLNGPDVPGTEDVVSPGPVDMSGHIDAALSIDVPRPPEPAPSVPLPNQPAAATPTRPATVKVLAPEFDPTMNILTEDVRQRFLNEQVYEETDIFTRPISTTNTVDGYIANVSFHEAELIKTIRPTEEIFLAKCNFGRVTHESYREPAPTRTSNRGRKKRTKKKKPRKQQGTGEEFSSQMTFWAHSALATESGRVYKFKVFRNGRLQLPGLKPHLVDDVIDRARAIARLLNSHLHQGEDDPARQSQLVNINPTMKNYKFTVKMAPRTMIDLPVLKRLLTVDSAAGTPNPSIYVIKYTRTDSKLSIKFNTPLARDRKKKVRVNIFMRGKINILGALHGETTRQICDYLHGVFKRNYNDLIVKEGVSEVPSAPLLSCALSREYIPRPIPNDEMLRLSNFIANVYNDMYAAAMSFIEQHAQGPSPSPPSNADEPDNADAPTGVPGDSTMMAQTVTA